MSGIYFNNSIIHSDLLQTNHCWWWTSAYCSSRPCL